MKILLGTFGQPVSVLSTIVRIALSILIGTIIGFEREKKNKSAGLKTHVLVSLSATLVALAEEQMIYEIVNLNSSSINLSFGRLTVGVITGVGFLGAGTIIMSKSKIVGLTTAASVWSTACLGLINGMGFSIVATLSAIVVAFILETFIFGNITNLNRIIEIKYIDDSKGVTSKKILNELNKLNVELKDYTVAYSREGNKKYCTTRYSLVFSNKDEIVSTMSKLSDIKNIVKVQTENVL